MEQTNRTTDGPLAQHNAQFSSEGLLQRYATARSDLFPARAAIAFATAAALALIVGLFWAALTFLTYVVADGSETLYLRRLSARLQAGQSVAQARGLTTLFSALYAVAVCGFATVPLLHPLDPTDGHLILAEPFFALCVVLGPSLSASLDYRYHPPAAVVRLAIFALMPLLMVAYFFGGHPSTGPDLQLIGAGFLAYYSAQIWFLVFVQKRHQHSRRAMRSQALQRQALEDAYMRLFDQKQEARRLAMIAEHANDGVMLIGRDGIVRWVNEGFVRMTGFSFDELVGSSPGTLLNSPETDPETLRLTKQGRAAGKPFRAELVNRRKDGQDIWIETNQVPIFDDNGRLETYIAVERDVTAAKQHESELEEARHAAEEGARIKEEFLATMSHEFRTPMNGVIGMAQMLQATDLSEDQKLYTETILSSSRALLSLINDVLDLSRMNAAGVSLFDVDFDLHSCIRDTALLLQGQASDKGLSFDIDLDPDLPVWVKGDDRRLRQILMNLVGNAVKFTQQGGVTLRARAELRAEQIELVVSVEDTGIGIPADKLDYIFERFTQADTAISRSHGGTGLGLSISRGLARAMGGDISVTSTPDVGSCFTLRIDLAVSSAPAGEAVTDAPALTPALLQDLRGLRLLVAEDNRVNRLLISKFLADAPVDLKFATNGAEAEALVRRQQPQVVLMDMSMPEVNGLQATRAIRKLDIAQPFIAALTANADETSRQACLEAGMDCFLSKPLSRNELLTVLLNFAQTMRETQGG